MPRVKTTATLPIEIDQVWRSSTKIGDSFEGSTWTVVAVGPVFCLMQDRNCESHLIQEAISVSMWGIYFNELVKGF